MATLEENVQQLASQVASLSNSVNDVVSVMTEEISLKKDLLSEDDNLIKIKKESSWFESKNSTRFRMARDAEIKKISETGQTLTWLDKTLVGTKVSAQELSGDFKTAGVSSAKMISGMDGSASSFSSLSGIVKEVGGAMGSLASSIPFLGGAIEGAIVGGAAVAGFALGQLSTQLESFDKVNDSGLLLADGMTGVNSAARVANLTLQDFSGFVKKSATDLAQIGGNMADGVREFTKTRQAMSANEERQMRLMGFTWEEQAEALADVMAIQQRQGNLNSMTDRQRNALSLSYTKNLKELSSLSGEDVDSLRKKQETERQNAAGKAAALELEMNGLEGAGLMLDELKGKAGIYGETAVKAVNEMMANNGRVVTEETNILKQSNRPLFDMLREQVMTLREGRFDTNDAAKNLEVFGKTINSSMDTFQPAILKAQKSLIEFAKVTSISTDSGLLKFINDTFAKTTDAAMRDVNFTQAAENIEKGAKTTDSLTNNMVDARTAMNELQIGIQEVSQSLVSNDGLGLDSMIGKVSRAFLKLADWINNETLTSDAGIKQKLKSHKPEWGGFLSHPGDELRRQENKMFERVQSGMDLKDDVISRLDFVKSDNKVGTGDQIVLQKQVERLTEEIASMKKNSSNAQTENEMIDILQRLLKETEKIQKTGKITANNTDPQMQE